MSLWVDKYRPNSLAKLTLHDQINSKLTALAQSAEVPHLLFYGPTGYICMRIVTPSPCLHFDL